MKELHWKKETWCDKSGRPIGNVLVKRDNGKILAIIYTKAVKDRKAEVYHRRHNNPIPIG